MVEVRLEPGTDRLEPTRRLAGWWHPYQPLPRSGHRIVLRREGGLLLDRGDGAAATPIPGERAWFYAGGDRLITAGGKTLTLVDATTGEVTKTIQVQHAITHGEVVDDRTFISVCDGSCPQADGSVLWVDLDRHAVEIDAVAPISARSRSGRWIATIENRPIPGAPGQQAAVVVRDARAGHRPRATAIGPWPAESLTLELDRAERRAVVCEMGLAGAGMFTARKPRTAVDLATGTRIPAPPVAALFPTDVVERWEQVEPRLRALPQAPRMLAPSSRGPGGSTAFAETSDGRTAVVFAGVGERKPYAYLVRAPQALVVEAPARLRHRVALPVPKGEEIWRFTTGISGDDRVAWTCLDAKDGTTAMLLLDLASGEVTDLGALSCVDLETSPDSSAVWAGSTIVDLTRKKRLTVVPGAGPDQR